MVLKVLSLLKNKFSFSELLPLFSARKDMPKLFPKTLLVIVSLFLMDGVLVHGYDSVPVQFLEQGSVFLLIAKKIQEKGILKKRN